MFIKSLRGLAALCFPKPRTIRRADLSKFVALLGPEKLPSARLTDRPDANVNCDVEKDNRDVETQPAE